jgi:TrmH family RNA methyltransferase
MISFTSTLKTLWTASSKAHNRVDVITSVQNPRIRLVRDLHEKKHRLRHQRFIVEYERDLHRALLNGCQLDYLLVCEDLLSAEGRDIAAALTPVYHVPGELLRRVAYRQNPAGLLAVMQMPAPSPLPVELDAANNPALVLVGLEKPGNIGALLRTANAAGITVTLLVDVAIDLFNPNIIRASTGACFMPGIYHAATNDALAFLRRHPYTIVAAHLEGTDLYTTSLSGNTALVLGKEDTGLDTIWVQASDVRVRIPMVGQVTDSLNVSVAGSIILYECLRQRRLHPPH